MKLIDFRLERNHDTVGGCNHFVVPWVDFADRICNSQAVPVSAEGIVMKMTTCPKPCHAWLRTMNIHELLCP